MKSLSCLPNTICTYTYRRNFELIFFFLGRYSRLVRFELFSLSFAFSSADDSLISDKKCAFWQYPKQFKSLISNVLIAYSTRWVEVAELLIDNFLRFLTAPQERSNDSLKSAFRRKFSSSSRRRNIVSVKTFKLDLRSRQNGSLYRYGDCHILSLAQPNSISAKVLRGEIRKMMPKKAAL